MLLAIHTVAPVGKSGSVKPVHDMQWIPHRHSSCRPADLGCVRRRLCAHWDMHVAANAEGFTPNACALQTAVLPHDIPSIVPSAVEFPIPPPPLE